MAFFSMRRPQIEQAREEEVPLLRQLREVHEAGHFVAAHAAGFEISGASVVRGRARVAWMVAAGNRAVQRFNSAVVLAAGLAAQRRFGAGRDYDDHGRSDMQAVVDHARAAGLPAAAVPIFVARAEACAAQFVQGAWGEIVAVARVLHAREDLDETECGQIVALLTPRTLLDEAPQVARDTIQHRTDGYIWAKGRHDLTRIIASFPTPRDAWRAIA